MITTIKYFPYIGILNYIFPKNIEKIKKYYVDWINKRRTIYLKDIKKDSGISYSNNNYFLIKSGNFQKYRKVKMDIK